MNKRNNRRRPSSARRSWRALAGAAAFACVVAITGCGSRVAHDAPSMTSLDPARLSETEARAALAEARGHAMRYPAEPYWPYRGGQIEYQLGHLESSEAWLRSAIERRSDYAPAVTLLSRVYWELQRHDDAVTLLEPLAAMPGAPPEFMTALALHWDALDEYELADALTARVEAVDGAERMSPSLSYLKLRGDDLEAAQRFASIALDSADVTAESWNNFGLVKLQKGEPEEAKRAFMKARDRDPELAGPYYNLAILEKYFFFDDDEARRWFGEYWARSHQDPDGLADSFGFQVTERGSP